MEIYVVISRGLNERLYINPMECYADKNRSYRYLHPDSLNSIYIADYI